VSGPDLTVVFAILVLALSFIELIRYRLVIQRQVISVVGFFGLLAVPVLWTDWTPYATEKVGRFFTLTLLATIAPLFLIRNKRDLSNVLTMLTGVAVIGSVLALVLAPEAVKEIALSPLEGGHIKFSRLAGMGAIVVLGRQLISGERRRWPLLLLVPLLYAPISAGSRGPVIAVLMTVLMLSLLKPQTERVRNSLQRLLVVGSLIGFSIYFFSLAPEGARERYAALTAPQSAGAARATAYSEAASLSAANVLGSGWGSFEYEAASPLIYPHNIVLEMLVEGGWVIALVSVLGFFVILKRTRKRSSLVLVGLLIFGALNMMISGDLNSNRPFFMLIGLALCVPRPNTSPQTHIPYARLLERESLANSDASSLAGSEITTLRRP